MRGLFFVAAVAAVALWWGGQNLWVGLHEREPVEITCADFIAHRPDAHWLKLTECDVDFDHLAYESSSKHGKPTAVYLPMRPRGGAAGPTPILVKRDDADMLAVAALDDSATPPLELSQRVSLSLAGPVEGVAQFGLDLSDRDHERLAALDLELASDFAIIEQGATPHLWLGLLVFAVGLLGAAWSAFRLLRRFAR
jgi:hypothetical protein